MMIKYISVPDVQPNGELSVSLLANDMVKVASYEKLPDELRTFIQSVTPEDGYAYLLIRPVNDLNWGPNNNGDAFPTRSLCDPGGEFGYKTYKKYGHWYHMHKNKDPKQSFGDVVESVWDETMGRILVVVKVDLKKDIETARDIENGIKPKTSMGCKVAYDICNVCHPNYLDFFQIEESVLIDLSKVTKLDGAKRIIESLPVHVDVSNGLHPDGGVVGIHQSPERYCHHIRGARNRLICTGERPMLINLRPVFFDISRVFVPADKSSCVMDKIASNNSSVETEGDFSNLMNKISDEMKTGEIMKEVNAEVLTHDEEEIKEYLSKKIYPHLYAEEKDMPKDSVDELTRTGNIPQIIESMFSLGMVPRPKEVQRIILISMGRKQDADELWDKDITFNNVELPEKELEDKYKQYSGTNEFCRVIRGIPDDMYDMLMPFMGGRSYTPDNVAKRIVIIKSGADKSAYSFRESHTQMPYRTKEDLEQMGLTPPGSPLLTILAGIAAYYGTMLAKKTMANPIIKAGSSWVEKNAGTGSALVRLLGIPTAAYLYAGHAYNRATQGEPVGTFDQMMIRNTAPAALATTALAFKTPRSLLGNALSGTGRMLKAGQITENIVKCGMDFDGISIRDYSEDIQVPIIVELWDKLYESSNNENK